MINDLLSSFDSTTNIFLGSFPIIIIFFSLILIPLLRSFFVRSRKRKNIFKQLEQIWFSQLKNSKRVYLKFMSSFILVLFFTILFLNIFRINPYFFPSTVHTIFSFTGAWIIWLAIILSRRTYNPFKFFAQFLPLGSPLWLASFITIIEFFRTVFRPVTLGFRLTANIIIGHVVLSLIRICLIVTRRVSVFFSIVFIFVFYFIFELIICFFQATVFSLLTSIYTLEHS